MYDHDSNWLPGAMREIFLLKNDADGVPIPTAVEIGSFGMGRATEDVLLQDFSLDIAMVNNDLEGDAEYIKVGPTLVTPITPLVRYGYKHKGYLQDTPVLMGAHVNRGQVVPSNCWNFLKPYRIYPGEVLRANYKGLNSDLARAILRRPSIVFNGVRVKDDRPCLLYSATASFPYGTKQQNGVVLNQGGLTCPADSPVDIYGVTATGLSDKVWPTTGAWQITGPDEREWYKHRFVRCDYLNLLYPTLPNAHLILSSTRWLSHLGASVQLGEERGWLMERDETFIAEVTGPATDPKEAPEISYLGILTLRGHAEVTHG